MRRINIFKINIIFLMFVVLIAFFSYSHKTYAADETGKITLTSKVNNVYNKVSNTYTYKLEAEDEMAKSVLKEPVFYEVKFDNVSPNSDNVAEMKFDIDFSKTNFGKFGYYKFIISEVNSSDTQTFPISTQKYEIIVVVTHDESNKFVIKPVSQVVDISSGEKTDLEFEHETVMTYINIEEYTLGKLAEKDKDVYFKYKVTILGDKGTRYRILGQDKQVVFDGKRIITDDYYEIKEGQENYIYVYLKHGQKLTIGLSDENINQVPIGTKYKLQKISARKWSTTINDEETKEIGYLVAGTVPEQNTIVIINERDFDVPITGIFMNILPFAILIILAVIGILYLIRNKKKDDNE